MILADKIIQLRKKNGWSQEDLAEKMMVTRQSVSKWEGAQSIPDIEKIMQLSTLFGVSTDYLLKDELEDVAYIEGCDKISSVRRVSIEEANAFLQIKAYTAKWIGLATLLSILSPICLILLGVASENPAYQLSENVAGGVGMIVLLLQVTVAVGIFIFCGSKTSPYEYLEKEVFELEYGVLGMVQERQKNYRDTHALYNITGTCLCILSVIPLFVGAFLSESDFFMVIMLSVMLVIIGIGVFFFIVAGINWESMQKLLQEGEYTRQRKQNVHLTNTVSSVYWLAVTAGYLAYSFITNDWERSWIVWPVAGVLYAAVMIICSGFNRNKKMD